GPDLLGREREQLVIAVLVGSPLEGLERGVRDRAAEGISTGVALGRRPGAREPRAEGAARGAYDLDGDRRSREARLCLLRLLARQHMVEGEVRERAGERI